MSNDNEVYSNGTEEFSAAAANNNNLDDDANNPVTGQIDQIDDETRHSQQEKEDAAHSLEFGHKFISEKFLRGMGLSLSALFIFEGLLCFMFCFLNLRSYILAFYYMLFGTLSIGAEFNLNIIEKYLRILMVRTTRGMWYIFLGTLALGGEWWSIIISIFLILCGLLNMCAGMQAAVTKSNTKEGTKETTPAAAAANAEDKNNENPNFHQSSGGPFGASQVIQSLNTFSSTNLRNIAKDVDVNIELGRSTDSTGNGMDVNPSSGKAYDNY